jgi:hypothetical protein
MCQLRGNSPLLSEVLSTNGPLQLSGVISQYAANRNAWATQATFFNYLRALDAKMSSQNKKILLSTDQCSAHPQDTSYLKNEKLLFFPPNHTSILQPPDKRTIRYFKYYFRKQIVRKNLFP